jgi:hypothetical protein
MLSESMDVETRTKSLKNLLDNERRLRPAPLRRTMTCEKQRSEFDGSEEPRSHSRNDPSNAMSSDRT